MRNKNVCKAVQKYRPGITIKIIGHIIPLLYGRLVLSPRNRKSGWLSMIFII